MMTTFADVTLPLWLVTGQWTLLFALGLLVIAMYRQAGYLQGLKAMGSEREGLPVGEKVPSFDHTPINQSTGVSARFEPGGGWLLLFFADPGCVSCQHTILALARLAPKLRKTMRLLVLTSAEPALIAAVEVFSTAPLEISRVHSDVPIKLFRTRATPFGYLIDPDGVIRAKGIAGDESSIRKLVRQVDRNSVNVEFVGLNKL